MALEGSRAPRPSSHNGRRRELRLHGTVVFSEEENPVNHNTTLYIGMLVAVLFICVISIAYRLQKLAAQRVDAGKRASVAFEEMNRLTKELRDRRGDDPVVDESLPPGERLRRMYPGAQRPTAQKGEGA
jgi:hypothetical protein